MTNITDTYKDDDNVTNIDNGYSNGYDNTTTNEKKMF